MAKFMDVHSGFVGVTEDQLREAHEHDLAIEASEGVHFERAWLDPDRARCSACRLAHRRRQCTGSTTRRDTPRTRSRRCRSRSCSPLTLGSRRSPYGRAIHPPDLSIPA
jgi:hypothetical protein